MLKLVVTLEKLDKDDEDLDIDGLSWDADNGIANWDHRVLQRITKYVCAEEREVLPMTMALDLLYCKGEQL